MPIKGISDVRRLPRLGKIRLGIKDTSSRGVEYPKPVDYFVVRQDAVTPEVNVAAFRGVYGSKPKVLDIMLPSSDREKIFPQYYRRYGKSAGLLCKGDGEVATELDRDTGELKEVECDPAECPWATEDPRQCRPVGSLQVLLHKVPGLGIWQLDTGSYHSIVNINSGLDLVAMITGGRFAMLPLKLLIRPREVQVPLDSGGVRKKTVYVLDVASQEVSLGALLRAAKKAPGELLLDGPDMAEAPDDLYPQSPAEDEPQNTETGDEEEEPGPDAALDPLDRDIETAFNRLQFDQAEREQWRAKYGQNREGLIHHLRKLGEEGDG